MTLDLILFFKRRCHTSHVKVTGELTKPWTLYVLKFVFTYHLHNMRSAGTLFLGDGKHISTL